MYVPKKDEIKIKGLQKRLSINFFMLFHVLIEKPSPTYYDKLRTDTHGDDGFGKEDITTTTKMIMSTCVMI